MKTKNMKYITTMKLTQVVMYIRHILPPQSIEMNNNKCFSVLLVNLWLHLYSVSVWKQKFSSRLRQVADLAGPGGAWQSGRLLVRVAEGE